MTYPEDMRRLPWDGPEGKPVYLDASEGASPLAQLADKIEAEQLAAANTVARFAREAIDDPRLTANELRFVAKRLIECLADVLRVAASQGQRLH